jgi:choline kinase
MRINHAVILAAGNGSRLGPLTADRSKVLLEVGGRTIIDRQLDALHACGVRHVTVVVGYQQQRLREHLKDRVHFVTNDDYASTNSLYSMSLAAGCLQEGGLVLNGDVVFTPLLLKRLMEHPAPDALLFDPRRTLGAEEMKVRMTGDFVIDLSKQLPLAVAAGENVGLLKFGAEGGRRLRVILDELVGSGQATAWAPLAVARLSYRWPIVGIDTGALPWTEVDFPEDLAYANDVIAPAIDALATMPEAVR